MFCIFTVGALLCPIMKLSVKISFLHLFLDIASISKIPFNLSLLFLFCFLFFFRLHDLNDFSFHKQVEVSCCLLFCVVIYFYIISLIGFLYMSYKIGYKLNEYPYKIILQVSTTSIYLYKNISNLSLPT